MIYAHFVIFVILVFGIVMCYGRAVRPGGKHGVRGECDELRRLQIPYCLRNSRFFPTNGCFLGTYGRFFPRTGRFFPRNAYADGCTCATAALKTAIERCKTLSAAVPSIVRGGGKNVVEDGRMNKISF